MPPGTCPSTILLDLYVFQQELSISKLWDKGLEAFKQKKIDNFYNFFETLHFFLILDYCSFRFTMFMMNNRFDY